MIFRTFVFPFSSRTFIKFLSSIIDLKLSLVPPGGLPGVLQADGYVKRIGSSKSLRRLCCMYQREKTQGRGQRAEGRGQRAEGSCVADGANVLL